MFKVQHLFDMYVVTVLMIHQKHVMMVILVMEMDEIVHVLLSQAIHVILVIHQSDSNVEMDSKKELNNVTITILVMEMDVTVHVLSNQDGPEILAILQFDRNVEMV